MTDVLLSELARVKRELRNTKHALRRSRVSRDRWRDEARGLRFELAHRARKQSMKGDA